ncbi:hypothetical protein [Paraburkholderia sartisoli]|uniref:hypothetical protein n=1 Tax=Paraburkholderia sartisoli TaxID=83784 RepID=UPI0024819C75|nr:hypothetical protein [Paraburkholderia sartisoli]
MRAGFVNLLEDQMRGQVTVTDKTAFEAGRNVALSKGSVVFENELRRGAIRARREPTYRGCDQSDVEEQSQFPGRRRAPR